MTRFLVCILCVMGLMSGPTLAAEPAPDLFRVAVGGDLATLQSALARGTSPDLADKSGKTLLMFAAENGQMELAAYLLFKEAKVDRRDVYGRTALMYALRGESSQEMVSFLIQAGADVNGKDDSGKTVLGYAEAGGDEEVVALLVSCGAKRPRTMSKGAGGLDTAEPFYRVTVHYATNRTAEKDAKSNEVKGFGKTPDNVLNFGTVDVAIPKSHRSGELEVPRLYLIELSYDPSRHVTVLGPPHPKNGDEFFRDIKALLKEGGSNDLLIFIHGYNVSFDDAARRTAQLSFDLEFKGVPLFFSWPSTASLLGYRDDRARIQATIPLLKEYLRRVAGEFKGARINIVAHSMGTFGFTTALKELREDLAASPEGPIFNQIILAAPDIDAETFKTEIAPKIGSSARRLTLYASSRDLALMISRFVNGRQRAGDTAPQILLTPGVDSIDVSSVDSSLLGHSYYGDNRSIITDIRSVIGSEQPDKRVFLEPKENPGDKRKYWLFNPLKLVGGGNPAAAR